MICNICNNKIKKNDDFVKVIDYKKGVIHKEGYYHNKCFNDKIKGATNKKVDYLTKMAMATFAKANALMEREAIKNG